MMCDMNKGAIDPARPRRLKTMALTDNVPLLTAWANDAHYEQIFAEQLKNFAVTRMWPSPSAAAEILPTYLLALKAAKEAGAS